ncbi:hypothetical protein ET445_03305 [Agromyces protaetiae]|uniref:Uncharacterized protein n=1 Tax=Agromyces protaetiae TaxID=2509455 RepID=A0A4V0YGV3_9MICO|nr:hypothetical protein [Agromyces protaetiae]QAY72511.1 hypothetical protein ET445_03305 [Agromyces protaetiae]
MPEIVLEPWSPWPLVFPALAVIVGAVLAIAGRGRRGAREIGYVLVVGGALTAFGLLGFLSGTWDQGQRTDALVELGYEHPTFSEGEGIVGGSPGAIHFEAERDGSKVVGRLVPLGDSRWRVVEGEPGEGERGGEE